MAVTLRDVLPLKKLHKLSLETSGSFILHGGIVTRSTMQWCHPERHHNPDIFSLVPFASDIDLIYRGNNDVGVVKSKLLRRFPGAEGFRWQITPEADQKEFDEALEYSHTIPARRLSIVVGPNEIVQDPHDGFTDILRDNYRFIRNNRYKESQLFRSLRDLEVFSALLYLRTLFEARIPSDSLRVQPGLQLAHDLITSASSIVTVDALNQSPYLKARFFYLAKNLLHSATQGVERKLLADMGFWKLLSFFTRHGLELFGSTRDSWLFSEGQASVISAHLADSHMRINDGVGKWLIGSAAKKEFEEMLREDAKLDAAKDGQLPAKLQLGPQQEVAMLSPILSLNAGISTSSSDDGLGNQEFVHFAIHLSAEAWSQREPRLDLPPIRDIDERDLSAVLMVNAGGENGWHFFSVPAIIYTHPYLVSGQLARGTVLLRMNCWNILATAAQEHVPDSFPSIRIAIVHWIKS